MKRIVRKNRVLIKVAYKQWPGVLYSQSMNIFSRGNNNAGAGFIDNEFGSLKDKNQAVGRCVRYV
jgi:hypothetical protein